MIIILWLMLSFYVCHLGKENNFRKVGSDDSTTHGVPYDYWSVMHYSKNAFMNGNGETIITKDPKFQDVIGQNLEISTSDVQELNLLYKCSKCQHDHLFNIAGLINLEQCAIILRKVKLSWKTYFFKNANSFAAPNSCFVLGAVLMYEGQKISSTKLSEWKHFPFQLFPSSCFCFVISQLS